MAVFMEQRAAAVTGAPREKPLVYTTCQVIKTQVPKELNRRGRLVTGLEIRG